MISRPLRLICGLLLAAWFLPAGTVNGASDVVKTTWRGLDAYKITDGRTEAIIVPQLGGRLMHYGRVGGPNFIWTGEPGTERGEDALMWGGDKTYIGPHTMWKFTQPTMWPPPAPNTQTCDATILEGGRLRTISPPWPAYQARVIRETAFDPNGDLVITHTIEKVPGSLILGAVWTVTQTIPTDAVYAPVNPKSPYKNSIFWFGTPPPMDQLGASLPVPSLLQIRPVTGTVYKLGVHPAKPALAALKDGVAFVQQAEPQEGQYPEGADGAGMSVEIYHHPLPPPREYTELEFLSPLRRLDEGASLTVRWRLQDIPKDAGPEEIARLLK